jgi:hypothetical protein
LDVLMKFEAKQDFFFVGQVADHLSKGRRQLLDQRRRGEDLVVLGELRMLEDVDDLELILTAELLFADATQVRDRRLRARGRACNVELEDKRGQTGSPCVVVRLRRKRAS